MHLGADICGFWLGGGVIVDGESSFVGPLGFVQR